MVKLNYKAFGEGRPIVFLHGLFGMLDNWQTFAKKMADDGFMVFLVDQRDHGRSPHTNQFSYELLAQDLSDFLEDQWVHKAIIVGHSMGGKVAMTFARDHEDVVEKLIVVDIAPKKYKGGHEQIFKALRGIDLSTYSDRNDIFDVLKKDINNEAELLFLMKNISRLKTGGFEYKMNLELLFHSYSKIMGEIKFDHQINVPTLFVGGSNSGYITDEDKNKIKETFYNVGFETIEGAGHWVHADNPDALFEVITNFINKK